MCTDEYFASLPTISWFKILNGTMCKVLQTGNAVYTANKTKEEHLNTMTSVKWSFNVSSHTSRVMNYIEIN